jgi:hypothetical protein
MKRTVVCPECAYCREVPFDLIPAGTAWATCPSCGVRFALADPEVPALEPVVDEAGQNAVAATPSGKSPDEETPHQTVNPSGLAGMGALFDSSYTIFKERVGTLLLLLILTAVLVVVPVGLLMGIGFVTGLLFPFVQAPLLVAGGVTGGVVGLALAVLGGAAFLCAVADHSLDVRAALEKGWDCYLPLLWLMVLGGFLQVGATFFFIIPGIILWVSFAFAPFIVVDNRARGFEALMMSLEYCSQHWFGIFFRLLVVWLVGVAIGAVPLVGGLLSLAYVPFQYLLIRELYQDVVALRGIVAPATGGVRVLLVTVAVLGWVLIPLALLFVAGVATVSQLLVI